MRPRISPYNKVLIYDDACPLCRAYSRAFVRFRLLQPANRRPFSDPDIATLPVNWERARLEIPLVNPDTGEVLYGVEAISDILAQKISIIKPLLKIRGLQWLARKTYRLVSVNRRVLVAPAPELHCGISCRPAYQFKYRLTGWMILMLLSGFFIFSIGSSFLPQGFAFYRYWLLLILALIPLAFQRRSLEWLTQMAIVLLTGSFLMLCSHWLVKIFLPRNYPVLLFTAGVVSSICCRSLYTRIQFLLREQSGETQWNQ